MSAQRFESSRASRLEDGSQYEEKDTRVSTLAAPAEKSTQPVSSAPNSKEGGLQGYLTALGAFLALFAAFGQANSFGTFQSWYEQHQLSHKSPSDISWIGTIQLWIFFFSGSIVGRFFDAYGPRTLLFIGTIIYTFSLMMTSLATEYYQFILAQGLLFGVGVGLLFYPSLSATSTHFIKRRALMVGVAVSGASVGGVAFPVMLSSLFNKVGFPWAVRILGFVGLACGTIATALCSSRLPKRKPGPWINVESFKDTKYMLFSIGSAICCFGLYVPLFYLVQYAEEKGISQRLSFDILAVVNGASAFGRILPGYLADVAGRYNLMIPAIAFSGIFTLALWLNVDNTAGIIVFAAIYGFFSGAYISLNTPCVAQISRPEQIGTRVGMTYTIFSFPTLVSGPIAGAILSRQSGDFSGLIVYTGVSFLVGSAIILVVKLMINPNIWAKV